MQYAFHFDASRCAQCFACEVACKAEHGLRPYAQEQPGSTGPRFRQVITVLNENSQAQPIQYISLSCMHCGDAACESVCPAKAIRREPRFGAVLVDRTRCIGCRYCSWACEFGAPQFGADGLMAKCDMCVDRLSEGLLPACVESCCGGAITIGPVGEVSGNVRAAAARKMARAGA